MYSGNRIRLFLVICLVASPLAQGAPRADDPLVLTRFLQTVLDDNPKVLKAKAALDEGIANERDYSRPLYNPSLDLDHERSNIETNTIGLSQSIDWKGKRRTRTKIGGLKRQVAEIKYHLVQLQIGIELLTAIANYQKNAELFKLAKKRLRLMAKLKSLAILRHQAGDLSPVEKDLTNLAFIDAQMKKNQAKVDLLHIEQSLINLVGRKLVVWPHIKQQVIPRVDSSAFISEKALYTLPNIKVAQLNIQIAQNQINLQVKRRSGDPTIGIRAGEEGRDKLTGFTLSIPLNVRNTGKAKVLAANALHIQAQREGEQAMRNAKSSIRSSEQGYHLTLNAWTAWKKSGRISLSRRYRQLQKLWQARELDTTNYLIQVNQTLEAESSGIKLKNQLLISWTHWLKATAGFSRWLKSTK